MPKLHLSKQEIKETLKRRWPFLLLEAFVLAAILALDLSLKDYLESYLSTKPGLTAPFIPGFMILTYSQNSGAGFGMFSDNTLALTIITAVVISLICLYLMVFHTDSEWIRVPLVMIAAGGIGNLVDRIAFGYVRDFFEYTFVDFAIFNIADVFVSIGAIMLVIALIVMLVKEGKKNKAKFEAQQAAVDAAQQDGENDGGAYQIASLDGEIGLDTFVNDENIGSYHVYDDSAIGSVADESQSDPSDTLDKGISDAPTEGNPDTPEFSGVVLQNSNEASQGTQKDV